MFGFVYAWYLMAVLLLELWFDYRRDFVEWSRTSTGVCRLIYRAFTLGVTDLSAPALRLDAQLGRIISIVGIPSAFLLHGYVGFIFGSIKANPWWGNVLMPIIFILSAVVSGMALCVFAYMFLCWARRVTADMRCLDLMTSFLFTPWCSMPPLKGWTGCTAFIRPRNPVVFLKLLTMNRLFFSLLILQFGLGTLIPLLLLGSLQLFRDSISAPVRRVFYFSPAPSA